jgi:hypothetical protein
LIGEAILFGQKNRLQILLIYSSDNRKAVVSKGATAFFIGGKLEPELIFVSIVWKVLQSISKVAYH